MFLYSEKAPPSRRLLACLLRSSSGAQFSLLSDVPSLSYSPLFPLSSLFPSSSLCLNQFLFFLYLSELVLVVSVTCGTELGLFSGRRGSGKECSLVVLVLGFSSCFELGVGCWISLLVDLGLLKELFLQLLGGEGIGRFMFFCVLGGAGF